MKQMIKNISWYIPFILIGCIIQAIVFAATNASILSLISGCCGIVSVVLCSKRNVWSYFWGFAQIFTYVYLCWQNNLYAEIGENIFYFVTMLFGLYFWIKHSTNCIVDVKTLPKDILTVISYVCLFAVFILYCILFRYTNDTQPFMDALSTVPAIIAQMLMITRYREQWIFWLIIDVASIIMWAIAGNWCLVAQFVFWTINCIYGFNLWGKSKA